MCECLWSGDMMDVELNGKLTGQFQDGDYTESGRDVDVD